MSEAARLAAIVDSSDDAIVGKTLEGIITSWNRAAERMFGWTAAEAIGRSITLIIPATRLAEEDMVLGRIRQGDRVDHFDTVRVKKDGTLVDVSLTISPVRDTDGRIIGASKIARDITARRRLEAEHDELLARERSAREEAQAATRVRDEFLATLSHELRTPLHAIVGWARMLQHGILDEPTTRHASDVILRNAEMQSKLIEDLLDFGRIHSGKLRLDLGPVYPFDVVTAALDSVQPAAEAKRITIHTEMDPRAGPVRADAARLQQVMWNLLMNAVKFTPETGNIYVNLCRLGSRAEIVVGDTGQGIAAHELPHIFEMFRQGDSGSTRRTGGLGLGLALVQHLVHLHGGTIEAASEGRGKGAEFRLTLPLLIPPATIADPAAARAEAPRISAVRVLVVEDDPDALEIQSRVLVAHGGEVRTARSVAEALDVLREWRPHVIVSDIEMAYEDGYTLVRRVRSEVSEDIPAIAVTAYGQAHDRSRVLAAGFEAHMTKPFDPAQLVTLVASIASH
ncbi:MAG TPA: PAS domain S-box protein [Methylomirabilota bacterium]|nr:PAS domain S-box protein [Methylomirabilota bacterium]